MSDDGGKVAFESRSNNLVAGDVVGTSDVYVWDRASRVTRRLSVPEQYTTWSWPDVSGDGRFAVATASSTWDDPSPSTPRVVLFDLAGGTSRVLTTSTISSTPRISRDGRYVSVTGGGARVLDTSTGGSASACPALDDVYASDLSANGRFVVCAGRSASDPNRYLYRWDRTTGTSARLTFSGDVGGGVISDDGARIVYRDAGGVWLISPGGTGRLVAASPASPTSISGDGNLVSTYKFDSGLMNPTASVWNASTGSATVIAGPPATNPVLSSNGSVVVYQGAGGDLFLVPR